MIRSPRGQRSSFGVMLAALLASLLIHAAALVSAPAAFVLHAPVDLITSSFSARIVATAPRASEPPSSPKPKVAPQPRARPVRLLALETKRAPEIRVIETPPLPRLEKPTLDTASLSSPDLVPEPVAAVAAPRSEPAIAAAAPEDLLPSNIEIRYSLRSSLVDGHANYVWRRDGKRYNIEGSLEANGFFAMMFVGRFEQQSRGELVAAGLKPEIFSLKRGDSNAESAEFKWSEGQIRQNRIAGAHVQPLPPGAQDLLSFIFQFGYEFAGQPDKTSPVVFSITNARKMDRYEFTVAGRETLDLPIGKTRTVHLIRKTADPGDVYEAWLAADRYFLPVKLRFMLGGKVNVEQIAESLASEP